MNRRRGAGAKFPALTAPLRFTRFDAAAAVRAIGVRVITYERRVYDWRRRCRLLKSVVTDTTAIAAASAL